MMQHNVIVSQNYFACLEADYLRSFIDKADKDYQVGQTVCIHETVAITNEPTGRTRNVVIRNVGFHIKGLVKGYCVVSFNRFG